MSKKKPELPASPDEKFKAIVREACDATPDAIRARDKVLSALAKYPQLSGRLLADVVSAAVNAAIYQARNAERSALKTAVADSPNRAKFAAKFAVRSFLDNWIVGDKRLGDATRDDLIMHAANERKCGRGHLANADFYSTIAAKVGPRQCVREAIDDTAAAGLWNATQATYAGDANPNRGTG